MPLEYVTDCAKKCYRCRRHRPHATDFLKGGMTAGLAFGAVPQG